MIPTVTNGVIQPLDIPGLNVGELKIVVKEATRAARKDKKNHVVRIFGEKGEILSFWNSLYYYKTMCPDIMIQPHLLFLLVDSDGLWSFKGKWDETWTGPYMLHSWFYGDIKKQEPRKNFEQGQKVKVVKHYKDIFKGMGSYGIREDRWQEMLGGIVGIVERNDHDCCVVDFPGMFKYYLPKVCLELVTEDSDFTPKDLADAMNEVLNRKPPVKRVRKARPDSVPLATVPAKGNEPSFTTIDHQEIERRAFEKMLATRREVRALLKF